MWKGFSEPDFKFRKGFSEPDFQNFVAKLAKFYPKSCFFIKISSENSIFLRSKFPKFRFRFVRVISLILLVVAWSRLFSIVADLIHCSYYNFKRRDIRPKYQDPFGFMEWKLYRYSMRFLLIGAPGAMFVFGNIAAADFLEGSSCLFLGMMLGGTFAC